MHIMQDVTPTDKAYPSGVPKLWSHTVEEHRRDVRTAIQEAAYALVSERGLRAVTMAEVAKRAGIGRATLYKYVGSVEEILTAHHAQHVEQHLEQLTEARDRAVDPDRALHAVLSGFARICRERARHGVPEVSALVHRGPEHDHAEQRVAALLAGCLAAAQDEGTVRRDVAPTELATYCLHALAAAGELPSVAAVERLVAITESALRVG